MAHLLVIFGLFIMTGQSFAATFCVGRESAAAAFTYSYYSQCSAGHQREFYTRGLRLLSRDSEARRERKASIVEAMQDDGLVFIEKLGTFELYGDVATRGEHCLIAQWSQRAGAAAMLMGCSAGVRLPRDAQEGVAPEDLLAREGFRVVARIKNCQLFQPGVYNNCSLYRRD